MIPTEIIGSRRFTRRLGWRPDIPDHRDHRLAVTRELPAPLPLHTTNYLGNKAIPLYDQGDLGSCGPNATLRAYRIAIRRTIGGLHDFDGARLSEYYWARALDGTESYDAGTYIRDCMKVLTKIGVAPERMWPYVVSRFAEAPGPAVVAAAAKRIRIEYLRVDQSPSGIKQALVARHAVVFGTAVFPSTMEGLEDTGMVPYPSPNESVLGGHALTLEDYDDVGFAEPMYLGSNSWGKGVGIGAPTEAARALRDRMTKYDVSLLDGYFLIPQRMVHNPDICDDLWAVITAS